MKFAKIVVFLMFQTFIVNVFPDDSLQSLYRKVDAVKLSTDSAEIIKAYKYLGDYLSDLGDFEKSNQYLQQALHFAQQVHIDKEIGSINNLLASNASYEGKRDAAIAYYHKALKAFADIKDLDKVAMILINMGSEYEFSGNMKMAIAYKLKALKNKIASGETKNLDYYYQQVGQLFKETDKTKWEFYVRKAYEISRTSTNTRMQTKAAIFNDLGGISKHLGKNEEALAWYDSMLVVSQANNYISGIGTAYSNRSLTLMALEKYPEAYADIQKAINYAEQSRKVYGQLLGNIHAANILEKMSAFPSATRYAQKALSMAIELENFPEEEAQAHLALARIGEASENWEMAYKHYNSYKEGIDSLRNIEIEKNMHEMELKYQTAEKEKEITRLDNENKLNNLQLQRAQIIIVSIVVFVLLLSVLAFVLYRRKQLIAQKQQAELKQKLLRSQMNPHFMFNTLNAINHYIQNNNGHQASDYLAQYSKLMRQILENSAADFVSLETEIEFLSNYLSMQQLRFEKAFTYNINVDAIIQPDLFEIPPMIAQPFIENAIEHGVRAVDGGEINISFKFSNNTLLLLVDDNGKGFTSVINNVNHRSFALDITRERLNISGKRAEKLNIVSPNPQTGKGTLVTIELPYKKYSDK